MAAAEAPRPLPLDVCFPTRAAPTARILKPTPFLAPALSRETSLPPRAGCTPGQAGNEESRTRSRARRGPDRREAPGLRETVAPPAPLHLTWPDRQHIAPERESGD